MAPKAKSKAKTAMEMAWEVETREQPLSRGRSDDLSDLATKVRKAINDNLSQSMTESEIYCTVVNGLTCFQQIMKDKEQWIKGLHGPMGSKYWMDIRTRYQGPDSMRQRIVIAPGTTIDKPVLSAIEAALKHPPQRGQLLGLCRRMAVYKQGNALALMRMLTSVCASASSKQLELGMEIVQCLLRVGAFTQLPEMTTVLRPKIDSVLLQTFGSFPGGQPLKTETPRESPDAEGSDLVNFPESYTSVIGSRMGPHKWIEANRGAAGIILPLASVDAVTGLKDGVAFSTVADDLNVLVSGTCLGQKLFGWATVAIVSDAIKKVIQDEVHAMASEKKITAASVVAAAGRAHTKIVALPDGPTYMEKKRDVCVTYGNWEFSMTVAGVEDEIQLNLQAAVRHLAVELGLLTALPAERVLVSSSSELKVEEMEKEVYAKAETARSTAWKVLQGEDPKSLTAEIMLDRTQNK
eukprot:6490799-Amphidinium_carterae.1